MAGPTAEGDDEFVISADEKTSIQARRGKHPTQNCRPRTPMHVEHAYSRCGAWTYIAALDVHRARDLAAVKPSMASPILTGSSNK